MRLWLFGVALILGNFMSGGLEGADEDIRRAEEISFFETKIRPVLESSCKSCHGPKVAESDLRLDSAAGLKQGGAVHGAAVVPGKPAESPLFQAIEYKDEDLKMPPKPGPLSKEVVADFRRWIERGAVWPAESSQAEVVKKFDLEARKAQLPWLWKAPVKGLVPVVNRQGWAAGEVDRFLLSALEKAGLSPAGDADDVTWLRRATFVLTGLPPTREEVEAFIQDKSVERRERCVDRLMASPAFGERWARHWMDLMRYAESRGHEGDYTIANAWRYRDYLISAFNDDVPYDQFVREHLAGDLLDQPRYDRKTGANESVLATGWPFLGEEVHSPVDIRQDETDRMDNKIDVLGKTFLGLTIACARCHDHKFDAISQKDYYALSGFFQGSTYRQAPFQTESIDKELGRELAKVRQEQGARLRKLIAQQKGPDAASIEGALKGAGDTALAKELGKVLEEARKREGHSLHGWVRLWDQKDEEVRRAEARKLIAESEKAEDAGGQRGLKGVVKQVVLDFEQGNAGGWAVDGPAFGAGPKKAGEIVMATAGSGDVVRVLAESAAVVDPLFAKPRKDPQSESEAGSLGNWLRGSGTGRTQKFTIQTGRMNYLVRGRLRVYACVASHYMLTGPLHGRLLMDLKTEGDQARWFQQDLTEYVGQRVVIEVSPVADTPGELLAIYEMEGPEKPEVTAQVDNKWMMELAKAVEQKPQHSTLAESLAGKIGEVLRDGFGGDEQARARHAEWMDMVVRHVPLIPGLEEPWRKLVDEWREQEKGIAGRIPEKSATAPALADLNPVDEHVLLRGGWRRQGPVAPRSLPVAFDAELSLGRSGSGRLELAQSLTRPDQPLLARVWVNRLWQHVFGRGIVPTPDNFGMLGMRPSHPELLDWLAVSFVTDDEWSTKKALKRLILSRAFGMESRVNDAAAETKDPENVLLHRGNLRRLEAEVIRDSMLAVSGRLDRKMYGPGVPVHLTEFIVGRGRPGESGPLDGEGRRSIYTAVRRNFLPTLLSAFDLPVPFSTVGRRNETNVPAQALALANDPFVIEQARFWAERELKEKPDSTVQERIKRMFQTALGRAPREQELAALEEAYGELLKQRADGAKRDDVTQAWADLGHALFSLNEFRYVP